MPEHEAEREMILELLAEREAGETIRPADAARALEARGLQVAMPAIQSAASALVAEGRIVATQKGKVVDVDEAQGPIRLGLTGEAAPTTRQV